MHNMANRTVTLIRNANIPGLGWRRGTLIKSKNGRYKDGYMLFNGTEYHTPQGTYQVRHYDGAKAKYTSVGNDLDAALTFLEKKEAMMQREAANKKLGIAEPTPIPDRKTLAELAAAYITKKRSPSLDLTKASIHIYERTLTGFVQHAKRLYPGDVTEEDVTGYIDSLIREGYSRTTRAMRYISLRGFLRNVGVDVNKAIEPSTHKRLSEKPDEDTTPYTPAQLAKLFPVCTPYYRMVFGLLLQTGMRFREASHLTWANVLWEKNQIFVPSTQRITNRGKLKEFRTKNRKGRVIPMYPTLKAALLQWRALYPDTIYVVGSLRGDQPNNHWITYGKKFWKDAGLNCGVCDACAAKDACEQFYLHKFRHTYAHRCLDVNPDIHELSRHLGHHDIGVTIIYLKGRTSNMANDPFASTFAPVPTGKIVSISVA
jgi:integrase